MIAGKQKTELNCRSISAITGIIHKFTRSALQSFQKDLHLSDTQGHATDIPTSNTISVETHKDYMINGLKF
jgi:hypothetical protein